MDIAEQKKRFYANVLPSRPNTWEVDEVFEKLAELDENSREALLRHVDAVWPVSHSLCFSYLLSGVQALTVLPIDLLGEWVRQILGLYEKKGLLGARQFMADVDRYFLGPIRGEAGVAFEEISATLTHYLRGVSGKSLALDVAPLPATDTGTIFLPPVLDTFQGKQNNMFLYKFLVSIQWGHIKSRVFAAMIDDGCTSEELFDRYPDRRLAIDLFSVLQFNTVFRYLESELPGLIRQGRKLCARLIRNIGPEGQEDDKSSALQYLLLRCVESAGGEDAGTLWRKDNNTILVDDSGNGGVLQLLPELYQTFTRLPGSYTLGAASLLLGEFDFVRAAATIRLRREEEKTKFVALLSSFLEQQGSLKEESEGGNVPGSQPDSVLLLLQKLQIEKKTKDKKAIVQDNEGLEIPEELAALIKDITDDLGTLPEAYVQTAAGQAGTGVNRQECASSGEPVRTTPMYVHVYDEWDYRRAGYRAAWCSLMEKSLHPVRSAFVTRTLAKYYPQLNKLRRQFEMLRTRERFVRRRRHGDDIDLDAHIEALGDIRAGLAPSDRLFVQLLRDDRDITAMFLVDMSNSTEGWVGVAVKEALVLLAEALEVVGDQYGIYGFSGMRRSRSEIFHIKHLEETYGAEVQARIAAIGPREYTRMGPPIRHMTKKLQEAQSAVRLLLVISDGKPEDYDDYKGQYAIEDTRKALLEAQGAGVHSFCVTIDKSAQDYLAHMFGRGNYIFVDNVLSLPAKMAEMYRLLTS
jgi:nitric oxide reductase NorD protein